MKPELIIDALAFGGNGVGRCDGKAVFVPLTAPGDRLLWHTVRDRKRFTEGEIDRLLTPSDLRREPPCPVFGLCGGCQWQHLPYEQQCLWKGRIFSDFLTRKAGIVPEAVKPIVPAPSEWSYRSRVQFKCRLTPSGFVMGFFRRGSHYVIDVNRCPITEEPLNEVLRLFRDWLPRGPSPENIPQVDLALGCCGRVRAVVHFIGQDAAPLSDYLRPLAQRSGFSLFLQRGRKSTLTPVWGDEDLFVEVGNPPVSLAYGPGGFAQVNREQNRTLVREVVEAASGANAKRILDLFCGMGNFSLPLARVAGEVVGVEDFPPSIDKARQNALRNAIDNAHFYARPAEGAAETTGGGFDMVVLDPPRTGAYSVIKDLLGIRPRHVLYVSCDPATLTRDLQPLLHNGYDLCWSRAFDLFPQTFHIESLTLLKAR